MIYLKNASGLQEVLISRDEPFSGASGGGSCRQCYEEGEEHQKEKLSGITIESNGDYTRADGWSAVTVNVDEGQAYQEGFNDGYIEGRAYQKSLLSNLSVTENGTYSDEEGFATVDVNVPQGGSYESGYTDGFQSGFTSGFTSGYTDGLAEGYDIRSRMITSTGITENGTYTNVSGWSAVTVNVPQSGTTGTEIPLTGNTFSADSYGRYYFDYDQSTPISSITISFTVQPEPPVPPATSDILYYRTNDKQVITVESWADFGAPLVSNTYDTVNDVGMMVFSGTVTQIPSGVFSNYSVPDLRHRLTEITIPTGCTKIVNGAFVYCDNLSRVELPQSLTELGSTGVGVTTGVFGGCTSLSSITLPNSLTLIGNNTFDGCTGLTEVIIPNSVTKICKYAFYDCTSISSLTISQSVTRIEEMTFQHCTSLSSITALGATAPTIDADTFADVKQYGTLTIPSGADYSSWMRSDAYYLGYSYWTVQDA